MQMIPEEVKSAFDKKLAFLKSFKPELEPKGVIRRDERGVWQCTYKSQWAEEGILICMYPDGGCFETHGAIGTKWMHEVGGWIGLPVSDEESDGPDHQISHFEHGAIRWSRNIDKCEVIPKDKLSWYNYRHGQLLGLLKEAVEISQPKRHEEALRTVQEKCIEDQFDVVLLGEFQDGKSTTLDVLCRGRELSPQGDGLKSTSAVPVSIEVARSESAPEGMKEWADLHFKSEPQIKDEIFDAFEVCFFDSEQTIADDLKPFIQGDGAPKENFREKFNLGNAEHFGLVRKIVDKDWENYAGNKGSVATHHRQQLEVLTIYLKYYGTPEYRALMEKKTIPVSEVAKYVYFPKDWKEHAPESLDFGLSFAECIFAFLDFAVIHIHSEILSRLNCRVTDCPGLGASAYDTAVACRALMRADGVWFVKKCDKQLGASTLGAIFDLIKDNGRLQRTGMALNLWKGHKKSLVDDPETGTCLVNYCIEQLKKDGLDFPVFWCNARLAYLSALGKRKIEDESAFTKSERKWMMEIIDEDARNASWSDEELWVEAVKAANFTSKVPEIKHIEEFGSEAVDLLWRHSNMDEAIEIMAKIVLEQKGRTILIDSGSKKALDVLERYEHELQLAEDNAGKNAEKVKEELAAARERMETFVDSAKKVKETSSLWKRRDNLSNRLADDFVRYAIDDSFCADFARRSASIVCRLNSSFGGMSEDDYKRNFVDQIYPELFNMLQTRFISFCVSEWKSDSRLENVAEFFERVETTNRDLYELVEKLQAGGDLFNNLPIPEISAFSIKPKAIDSLAGKLIPIIEKLRRGFWSGCLDAILWVIRRGRETKVSQKQISDISKKLVPEVAKIRDSETSLNKLRDSVKPIFLQVTDAALAEIDSGIDACKESFEDRCKELDAANNEKEEVKRKIAAENHRVRTGKVQPLRERLETFENDVEVEL